MSKRVFVIFKALFLILLFSGYHSFSQTNTTTAGNWNTGANWSAGVPAAGTNATVNHAMTINTNITASPGDYTINQPITDITGGTAYTLTVGGTGGNQGNFDLYANALFEGALTVNGNGTLTIRSGYTLTVGATTFANNSTVVIESGATLIINGDFNNNNNSTGITINGDLIVNGNVNAGNGSAITGSGTLSSTGTITTDAPTGSIFGSTGDCTTGPCSGGNLCVVNTIGTAQTICSGATPAGLTGNNPGGSYTYKWQKSTTSAIAGFTDIAPAVTSQGYPSPGAITVPTWFRRIVTNGTCTATSVAIKISMTTSSWTGTTNTAWATTTNWSCGSIPTSTTDVIIPSGVTNKPVISSSINVKNLTINASAKLITTSAGTLNLYGNFINNGTYYDAGTTAFVGSTAQVKSGVADSLNNMTVNNAAGVTISSATYVKKYLTLTAGTLASGGNLTVDLYFGSILGAGAGSITGNIRVVRTIWKDNWHYISSPLSGRTVADWNDDVVIKFGTSSNLYAYDETVANANRDIGWTSVTTTSDAITMMKGYALYFTKWVNQTQIDLTGTYNHAATYSATLTNTASGTALSDGWNLVGNPYPSEIDWNAASGWTKTGLDNAIYFWDQANNRYASFVGGIGTNGGTRYIPCMQAFYVRVTNPGTGTLAMNNNVRSSVVNRDNWRVASQEDPMIRLRVDNGLVADEAVIRFSDEATDSFDSQLDARKLPSGGTTPSLSTKSLNIDYTVNSIPLSTVQKTIPVKVVAGLTGDYTISGDITGFDDLNSIVLEDKLLNVTQDLKLNPNYVATLTKADTASRFYIHYKKVEKTAVVTGVTGSLENAGISIVGQEQTVTVLFSAENSSADIAIYDVTGNLVYKTENKDVSSGKATIVLPQVMSGIYIVKTQTTGASKTQQVFLSK